ncbi:hypothetical protein GGH12_001466 [Coemansia sp. RSA 1822]|nr:hypothetical protein GGH12_001466 [Coemansia sp. RSA 1822]
MAAKQRSLSTTVVARAKQANYRYELMTGIYILETWEKHVFNVLALVFLVFVFLKKLNYQYEVTTGLYMLETWEKYIVNGVVCAGFSLLAYTAINHLPTQGMNMMSQLSSYATI